MEKVSGNSAPTHAEPQMTFKDWLAVFGAILGAFLAILDIQITNAAIREVTGGLGATIDEGSWISTSYLVAEIIIIPLSGWLSRLFSFKRYLTWTASLFLLFSVCCGLSRSLPTMILFRALQGFTGGALIPLSFQVILGLPPSRRTIGMALFSITATFAPAIGPTVGGYLTENFHWPVIFFLNIVPGAFMLFTVLYAIKPEAPDPSLRRNVDWPGIATMAIGLSSLTIFLEEGQRNDWFSSHLIVALALLSAVSLVTFIAIELRTSHPFINLRLLKQRNFGLGCLVNVVIGLAMYGALYLLPMYLSTIQDYNAVHIGETMMWAGFPQLLILPFVPRILARVDSRLVAFTGILIFAGSCLMNSHLTSDSGIEQLRWSQMVRAMGQPLLMVPLSTITISLVAREQSGSASGLFNMLRNLGGSVGIAMLSTLLTLRKKFHSAMLIEGVRFSRLPTRLRLAELQAGFVSTGIDPVTASRKAVAALDATVRKQAYIMAFNDCFLVVGLALAATSCLILFCRKVQAGAGPSEAH